MAIAVAPVDVASVVLCDALAVFPIAIVFADDAVESPIEMELAPAAEEL